MVNDENTSGETLLSVIESIIRSDTEIIAEVERLKVRGPDKSVAEIASEIIVMYSNRSAISGGASALPALIPGWGTLVTMVGSALLDTALLLKFEVEMSLALSWNAGFDIRESSERQMAFLLASISTYDIRNGDNFIVDVLQAEGVAIWNYAPRQVSKVLLIVLGRLALMNAGKSMLKALPLVGVAIGSGVNKYLTTRIGNQCTERLQERLTNQAEIRAHEGEEEPIVDAIFKDEPEAGNV